MPVERPLVMFISYRLLSLFQLETLLRLIQKLQSAPSTNAAIRSRIAELPSVITDPVAIDKLSGSTFLFRVLEHVSLDPGIFLRTSIHIRFFQSQ